MQLFYSVLQTVQRPGIHVNKDVLVDSVYLDQTVCQSTDKSFAERVTPDKPTHPMF